MATSDISLTAGMRTNLLNLQNTSQLLNRTQQRLSSGKQVNSALDNPTNYFAAQNANQRASDLADRKDGMSEGVQTVSAANAGITAITGLINAAKGIAQSALSTSDTLTRSKLATQYDTIRSQIDNISSDSGYRGLNLLSANNTLTVNFNENASSSLNVVGFLATSTGLSMGANSGAWATASDITTDTAKMDTAISTLRSNTQTLAANLNIITTRQNFTDSMINTLQTGADNLTLADMNQEGANMLMLQTRQSLGTTSLSMSSQAAQSVLKLF
ncbi:flagellin [Citrifermentans bemidjiense Bem]|uniref:Flagellin n=1 Tax=Citrifermentans bemidjiense (strain ATCC BAA-1014 / DSM 16622 / JCM 12645 / Bem) TaxID=404380 RepID=B5E8F4_CITBB|nr:flagellin [Citrifermentans bemidjiense]ACH37137.1 flagellin [Citrifermentans bemidjiense Bem]